MKSGLILNPQIQKRISGQNLSFLNQILKGLGQIMLQENAVTGLLFLAGIFYGSVTMGIAAIVATSCGTIAARLLKYNKEEIEKGLYGFSAALTGVALILFFRPVFIIWIFIIIGSVAAAIIQHFFIKRNIPVFTFPFVLVTWGMIFLIKYFYPGIISEASVSATFVIDNFAFAIKGFGQVIFQENLLSGALFFIAVFISSPRAALYGLAAALLAGILSRYLAVPVKDINMGLFSFNAVLCAIVFAGSYIRDSILVLISVILSLVISLGMFHFSLIQLTFPFVAASYITLVLKKKIRF